MERCHDYTVTHIHTYNTHLPHPRPSSHVCKIDSSILTAMWSTPHLKHVALSNNNICLSAACRRCYFQLPFVSPESIYIPTIIIMIIPILPIVIIWHIYDISIWYLLAIILMPPPIICYYYIASSTRLDGAVFHMSRYMRSRLPPFHVCCTFGYSQLK